MSGPGFTPPELTSQGGATQRCRFCGAAITWRKTQAGRWQPISVATGEPHFADCAPYQAQRSGQPQPSGEGRKEAPSGTTHKPGVRHLRADGRPWYAD